MLIDSPGSHPVVACPCIYINNTARMYAADMTYIESLSSTSWIVAHGNIIQCSIATGVQERIEEAKSGLACTDARIIQHGNDRGECG